MKTVEPGGKTTYFPFPNYEETVVGGSTIKRSSYALAGQVVAFRVAGDPVPTNNGLFFSYGDHLGSTSVLQKSGDTQPVAGSWTRYRPFGSYRTAPTQTLTDRDFTGQRENRELGLLYYNARFYHPASGRFISPDTIVPDPTNPQQFNRYTYSLGNPVKFVDPSGHCVETYQDDDELMAQCFEVWNAIGTHFSGIVPGRDEYPQEYMHSLMMSANIDQLVRIYQSFGYERFDYLLEEPTSAIKSNFDPDFGSVSLSGGIGINGTTSLTKDRYGNVYFSLGGEFGLPGFSGSITAGQVIKGNTVLDFEHVTVDEAQMESILSGYATSISGGYGVGGTFAGPFGEGNEGYATVASGIYSPQAGGGLSHSWLIYDANVQSVNLLNSRVNYWYHYQRSQ